MERQVVGGAVVQYSTVDPVTMVTLECVVVDSPVAKNVLVIHILSIANDGRMHNLVAACWCR